MVKSNYSTVKMKGENENMFSGYNGKLKGKVFKSDGCTSAKRSCFDFTTGKESRATNEDRNQLLTLFSARKAKNIGYAFVAGGFVCMIAVISTVLATAVRGEDASLAALIALPFMIPAVGFVVFGIYSAVNAPNRENSVLRIFEFEVHRAHIIGRGRYASGRTDYDLDEIPEVTAMMCVSTPAYGVILNLGGNLVELCSKESVAAVRGGVKKGDKVRMAVLDNGKKIFIAIY